MPDEALLDSIYALVTQETAMAPMLGTLKSRFGCSSSVLFYLDRGRPNAFIEMWHGPVSAARARYHADYADLDPAPAVMGRLRVGEAAATDRLFSAEYRAQSRFIKEFYHPLGLREALGAPVAADGGRIGLVSVLRGPDRPSFKDDEIATFGTIATHIARAVELRRRFFGVATAAAAREKALDAVAAGLMVFDHAGRLDHANSAARDILARGDGLILSRSGRLGACERHPRP